MKDIVQNGTVRRALLLLSTIAVAFSSAWSGDAVAQEAQPTIDTSSQEAVTLRYKFEEGRTDRYSSDIDMQIGMSGAGLPGPMNMSSDMSMGISQQVVSTEESGAATLRVVIESVSAQMTMGPGQQMDLTPQLTALNGFATTMRMTPRGEVSDLDVELPESMANSPAANVGASLEDSLRQMSPQLPEGEINVGDSWTQEIPLDLGQGGVGLQTNSSAAYTFAGYADLSGTRCAVLSVEYNITMSGTITEQGQSIGLSSTGTGSGHTYFDPEVGRVVRTTSDITLNQDLDMSGMAGQPGMPAGGGTMNQTIAMSMDMTLQ